MEEKIRDRSVWIARNVLPWEAAIRAWLRRNRVADLEVDDIIQEMYARIVSLDSFDGIHNPKQYCFQVAHSVIVDYTRRARIVSICTVGDVEELGLATTDSNPEQTMCFREEIRRIADAIDALPERTRDVLMMRRVVGFNQRETAERLSVTEKTVEKHMARGVLMLMTQFGRGGKSKSGSSKVPVKSKSRRTEGDSADKRH